MVRYIKVTKDQHLSFTSHLKPDVKFSGTKANQKFTFHRHENSKTGVKMKKVNKTNMVRLAITNNEFYLFEAIEPYIKKEFSVESMGWFGRAYIYDKNDEVVASSYYGNDLPKGYTGQSFVLELPEYILNEEGITASQDFEDKISRNEILTEIDQNGRVKFYGI